MSAPWGLMHSDDSIILTVDVEDSPIAELRLTEIYDAKTSTINDDYDVVFKDYITLQLENTCGLEDQSRLCLLNARFCTFHCRANGDLISLRKPAMERLIRQSIQNRLDNLSPITVSILIRFKVPGFCVPRRIYDVSLLTPKIIGRIGRIGSRIVNRNRHLVVAGTAKDDHDKSDIGSLITTLLPQYLHNDVTIIATTTDNGGRSNLAEDVTSGAESNGPGFLICESDPTSDCEDPLNPNHMTDIVMGCTFRLCPTVVVPTTVTPPAGSETNGVDHALFGPPITLHALMDAVLTNSTVHVHRNENSVLDNLDIAPCDHPKIASDIGGYPCGFGDHGDTSVRLHCEVLVATNSTNFGEQSVNIGIGCSHPTVVPSLRTIAILKAFSPRQRDPLCGNHLAVPIVIHRFAWLDEVYERADNPFLGVHCQHAAYGGADSRRLHFSVLTKYRPFDRGRFLVLMWAMSLLDFL
jgi:hypothetical protein